jgi:acyl-CoA thioester hydrolase
VAPLPFSIDVRVQFADTDAAGIVWFGSYLRFFEQAEDALFRALGQPRERLMAQHGVLLPRVEARIVYRAPLRAGDLLGVSADVEVLNPRRLAFTFLVRGPSGEVAAEGSYRVACVSTADFAACDFPSTVLELLARAPVPGPGHRDRP